MADSSALTYIFTPEHSAYISENPIFAQAAGSKRSRFLRSSLPSPSSSLMAAPTVSAPYTGQGYYATPQPLRHPGHDTGDLSAHPYLSHGVKLEHPTTPDIPHGLEHYHHSQPRTSPLGLPVASSLASQQPLGSYAAMSAYQSHWPATASTSSASSSFGTGSANVDGASNAFALPILHTLSDAHSNEDEYEDGDELGDLPALAASGGSTKHSERSIRRRSSKGVCDLNPPPPRSADGITFTSHNPCYILSAMLSSQFKR
jgi:hypothetical protein